MNLLELRKSQLRKNPSVKEILDKVQKIKPATTKVKAGGSLITRIQNICEQVQARLGKYQDCFELIQTKQRLHEYIDKCIENGVISIDTETTGLDPITDQIVGGCIYTYNEKAAYIPINHISYITNVRLDNQLTEQEVAEEFQRLVDAGTKVIMFNAKFDIRVIRNQLGDYMTPAWCGFIAGKCLKENEEEGNLKYLWKKYCSPDKEDEHFTFDKMFEGLKFNLIPITTAYLYAAKDALMTMELYDFQKRYLDENDELCQKAGLTRVAKLYNEIELPIINIVADIEDTGVALDLEYIEELKQKYHKTLQERLDAFYNALKDYAPQIYEYKASHPDSKIEDPINVGSATQLAELFYDVLKLPSVDKKQPRGTGEPILAQLKHPLCKYILDYRETAKMISTYIDKMPEILNKKTKRLHCSFNQYGASTGRFSSNNPNLQNIPSHNKDIRPMFIATRDLLVKGKNTLNLLMYDKINTVSGFEYVQNLTIDTVLLDDSNNQIKIDSINIDDVFYTLTINSDKVCNFTVKCKHVMVGADYSQQEPKLTADLSNDEKFIADCAAGKDAYGTVASLAFNKPYEECLEFRPDGTVNAEGKERRTQAKSILLGICYGRTVETIADQLNCTKEKAQEVYDAVLRGLPGLKNLMEESQEMARVHGWVETKWGRRRHIPEMQLEKYEITSSGMKSFDPFFDSEELGVKDETEIQKQKIREQLEEAKYYKQKLKIQEEAAKLGFNIKENTRKIEDATRQCVNSRIQGSAADQTKIAMRLIGTNEALRKYKFRMLLLVHDEIIGEVPLITAKRAIPVFQKCMLDAASDLRTGAKCDVEITWCWYGKGMSLDDLSEDLYAQMFK